MSTHSAAVQLLAGRWVERAMGEGRRLQALHHSHQESHAQYGGMAGGREKLLLNKYKEKLHSGAGTAWAHRASLS